MLYQCGSFRNIFSTFNFISHAEIQLGALHCCCSLAAATDTPGRPNYWGWPQAAVRGESIGRPVAQTNGYKLAMANRIAAVHGDKMYPGRPQALLRSVVVVKYAVDGEGLVRSEIMRSNR